ncbi:aspartyl protease family protein At5g10770-like [Musa acuminata AAA Group]|uniref:aspartyl protease family protein At5g10770-like n=1 Tax=Musa acuminata AAA Group TaxID=214697 RepID=UPI0031DEAE8E
MASLSSSILPTLMVVLMCSHVRGEQGSYHKISIHSLLPSKVCSSFKESANFNFTRLKVTHRHGPCSPLRSHPTPLPEQILDEDRSRVDSLRRRIAAAATSAKLDRQRGSQVGSKIPVRPGSSVSTGNYVVTVGFGTPKRDQTVIFDTGSDITWIQCQPCVTYCYEQQDPIFNPSASSTYANISCSSTYCSDLDISGCSSSACLYGVQYGDNSFSIGFFAQDTLTLSPTDVIPKFPFGCGERNRGLFGKAAGLMGLGHGKLSLVTQTYQKYGGVFAYCLPPTSSSTGYLTFGTGYPSSKVKFTPMVTDASTPTFYYLNLMAISVAGQRLPISAKVFNDAGTIIDSGTVITRLPPTAYSALRSAFRQAMSSYKKASALSILDTCYDFTGHSTVSIPTVALQFGGGVTMELDLSGTLYVGSQSQVCLAFAANGDDSDVGILGNVQQKTFNVVYDVSKKKIGFGPGAC